MLCRSDLPFLCFEVALKGLVPQLLLDTDCIDRHVVIVGQHFQAPQLLILRFDKKIEPEHILKVCVTGSIVDRSYAVVRFVVPCLYPVQEVHEVFVLPFKVQLIDLCYLHRDLFEIFQIVADCEGSPFHGVWGTVCFCFVRQIPGGKQHKLFCFTIRDKKVFDCSFFHALY